MNVNRDIANRALAKAGQEPLVDDDITKNTARWRTIKGFYLATILETLSHASWTSQKKRASLNLYEGDNLSDYAYCYRLPIDCAKPEEISNKTEFITEGNLLYTDEQDATLLYISSGYVGQRYQLPESQPTQESFEEGVYYTYDDETETYSSATTFDENETYYIFSTDDYPAYEELNLDPMLSQFIETRLASKIVLKITGDEKLYQLLYNEALLIEQKAINTSYMHARSKAQGNVFWAEQLGLN